MRYNLKAIARTEAQEKLSARVAKILENQTAKDMKLSTKLIQKSLSK